MQAVIGRLSSNNRLEICVSTYSDVCSSNVRECLEPLGLDYVPWELRNIKEIFSVFLCVSFKEIFHFEKVNILVIVFIITQIWTSHFLCHCLLIVNFPVI